MHCILYPLRIDSHGMPMTTRKTLHLCLGFLVLVLQATASAQSSNPYTDGTATAPDEWLLVKKGQPWWYETQPSPAPHLSRFGIAPPQLQSKR